MSWAAKDSFSITTANGFVYPPTSLLAHTVASVTVALSVLFIVWNIRSYVLKHARSFVDASAASPPPAQAYTVEIQGLRVNPPVTEKELREAVLDRFQAAHAEAEVMSVSLPLDVTDVADLVEHQRGLRAQLARFKQQAANDGVRPTTTVGMMSWLWIGEKVDAIEHVQQQITDTDRQLSARRVPAVERARFGTGTAFITFTRCSAAAAFLEAYTDIRAAARSGRISISPSGVVRSANHWVAAMAHKPEDIVWRNLRYTQSQLVFMVVTVCLILFVAFTFIVTPIFFIQILIFFGDATIEGTPDVNPDAAIALDPASAPVPTKFESYYRSTGGGGSKSNEYWAHLYLRTVARLLLPLFILLVNFFLMPYMVHYAVRSCGFRVVSSRNRAAFCIICAFMLFNVLIIPALSLSGLDEFFQLTRELSFDQVLAVMMLYGSSTAFFIDYVFQAALLGSAFYFVFHTTSPLIVHWASEGKEQELVWELDFAYFYSSAIVAAAIGIVFIVVLPLSTPFVALLFAARYYTDKWQLLTAHSNSRFDPSPESTVSAALVMLLIVTAVGEAAFAAWLNMQAADALALFPWLTAGLLLAIVCIPQLQRQLATISARWENGDEEALSTVPAPQAYADAYQNPYMHASDHAYVSI